MHGHDAAFWSGGATAPRALAMNARDEGGVLAARRRLDAGGHVDARRAGDAERLGDVSGRKPAGKQVRHVGIEAVQQRPVERRTVAAGKDGVLRRLGIEQQPVGDTRKGKGAVEVGSLGDRNRLHHLPAEALANMRDALRVFAAVKLEPIGADRLHDLRQARVIHIHRHRDDLRAARNARGELRRTRRTDETRALRKEVKPDHVGAGGKGRVQRLLGREAAYLDDQAHGSGIWHETPGESNRPEPPDSRRIGAFAYGSPAAKITGEGVP